MKSNAANTPAPADPELILWRMVHGQIGLRKGSLSSYEYTKGDLLWLTEKEAAVHLQHGLIERVEEEKKS